MTHDASSPPHHADSAYDRALAVQLAGGDGGLADELLNRLLAEVPVYEQGIRQARAEDDWPQLWEHVHKLHGGASYCGVPALKSVLAGLEQAIIERDVETVDFGLSRLDDELERLRREVENRQS